MQAGTIAMGLLQRKRQQAKHAESRLAQPSAHTLRRAALQSTSAQSSLARSVQAFEARNRCYTIVSSVKMLQPGQVIANRYKLQSKFARGTFCDLWSAVDTGRSASPVPADGKQQPEQQPRRVAVKVETAGMESSVLKGESSVLLKVQSLACVPRHVAYLQHDTRDVLIMELLTGEDVRNLRLRQSLPAGQGLPVDVCVDLTLEMLRCLEAFHSTGFIHRDVNPGNFVRRTRTSRELVLVDFGLAREYLEAGQLKAERQNVDFRGTTTYASPFAHERR
jgi:serine/threonine protein kinase